MNTLKSNYELLIEKFEKAGKVTVINETQKSKIFEKAEKDLFDYRFENQKKIRESHEEISTVVLTS